MLIRVNTGYYRVCKHQIGNTNSIECLIDGDIESINSYWHRLNKEDPTILYYKEEEVVYRGNKYNQYDEPFESSPVWIKF